MKEQEISCRRLLATAHHWKYQFNSESYKKKDYILRQLAKTKPQSAADVRQLHQLLLFLQAFPQSRSQWHRARQLMVELVDRLHRSPSQMAALENSGMSGTVQQVSLSFRLTQLLHQHFPDDIALYAVDASRADVEQILCTVLPDPYRSVIEVSQRSVAGMLRSVGVFGKNGLAVLLDWFRQARLTDAGRELCWTQLKVFIRWKVADSVSLSTGRVRVGGYCFHHNELKKTFDLRAEIAQPLSEAPPLSPAQRKDLFLLGCAQLALNKREIDPLTYGDVRRVRWFSLGGGLGIALFEMIPAFRLPLESYVGYLLCKNRMIIAYGGSWLFLHRARTGIHLFSPYRGGESAWAFAQVLRCYHQLFGVRQFIADPFQLGRNNTEGMRSGAFWFYYRLGFRPQDERLCREAEQLWLTYQSNRKRQAPQASVKRFVASPVTLCLADMPNDPDPIWLTEATLRNRVQDDYRTLSASDRYAYVRRCLEGMENDLAGEQRAIWAEKLFPFVVAVQMHRWSPQERKQFVRVIRHKWRGAEATFVWASQRSPVYRKFISQLERAVG